MIDEKGLVRAMKWAYKIQGYSVVDHGTELSIFTDGWYVRCDKIKLPRKALALLAEHMGLLTMDGDAFHVRKDFEPQMMMTDVVGADINTWNCPTPRATVAYTTMQYGDVRILQNPNDFSCHGVRQDYLDIVGYNAISTSSAELMADGVIRYRNPGELVVMTTTNKTKFIGLPQQKVWEALETVSLTKDVYEAEA